MSSSSLPPTISDDPSVIPNIFSSLTQNFHTGSTRSIESRRTQLQNLLRGLRDMEQIFHDALQKDLGVTQFNSFLYSYKITLGEVEDTLKNLDKWTAKRSLETTILSGPAWSYLQPEPYGVVLVMSAWNYPLYTSIPPLAQAIAAGNCTVLKPSELSPHTSKALTQLFTNYLDKNCHQCIEGQIQVAQKITTLPWGLIIFTGSPEKGRLVSIAAAQNLVPCLLELGGKSPTIVDSDANLDNAALRITQGRFTNSGQTCIACDYAFVHTSVKKQFLEKLSQTVKKFYGENPERSADYSRIVNQQATARLGAMLDQNNHQGSVLLGGQFNVQEKYVAPTIIVDPAMDSKIMTEEIFGPILPIQEFTDINTVILHINARPKPLALYYFGSRNKDNVKFQTSSGAFVVNEALFQPINPYLPFGGVGMSGSGKCHGQAGFDSCSHLKPVFEKAPINCFPFSARFPPYTQSKQLVLKALFSTAHLKQSTVVKALATITALLIASKVNNDPRIFEAAKDILKRIQTKFSRL